MKVYYCWRCKKDMPFLEEEEWRQITPFLTDAMVAIKDYRKEHRCDIATARSNVRPKAMIMFEEMTGMPGVHYDIIHHDRLADKGPECKKCGHLFRTPKASYCVNCGQTLEQNEL